MGRLKISEARHSELRAELMRYGMTQGELADRVGISRTTLYKAFSGERTFTMDEAYKILDALIIPHTEIGRYFPPRGVAAK